MFINKGCIEQIEYVMNNSDDDSLAEICKDFIKYIYYKLHYFIIFRLHYPKCKKYSSKSSFKVIPGHCIDEKKIKEEEVIIEKSKSILCSSESNKIHYKESIGVIKMMEFSYLLPISSITNTAAASITITERKLKYSLEMVKDREEIKSNINQILMSICCGIKCLNSVNLIHGSLSPNNILFDEDCNLYLDDYCLYNLRYDTLLPFQTFIYSSPEIILKKKLIKKQICLALVV